MNIHSKNIKRGLLKLSAALLLATTMLNHANAQTGHQKIHVGFIYPISTNGSNAAQDTNRFSLNLLAGLSKAETGATIAGFSNVVRENATGVQIAGFSNHIGKAAKGTTLAGFVNTYGSSKGLSAAGFANIGQKSSEVQLAGFVNVGGNVSGLQAAGFANIAKDVKGPQLAGFVNVSKSTKGAQVAGFVNQSGNVKGFQVAGFVNYAKKIKGTQVAGFINIADSATNQIGIVNISKNGEMSLAATFDEMQTVLLSFRSGGKLTYGILGAGYNFKAAKEVYVYQAGLGLHVVNTALFRLNTEVTGTALLDFKVQEIYKTSFSVIPSLRLGNTLEIFGGPSLNYLNSDTEEGRSLNKKYISTWGGKHGNNFQGMYLGYTAGIGVKL